MKSTGCFAVLALASFAVAQIGGSYGNLPSGLAAVGNPHQTLAVTFPLSSWDCGKQSYVSVKPGQHLTPSDTHNAPLPHVRSISPASNSSMKYVFIMVDPSTNATDPTYPALHTIYANVTSDDDEKWTVLAPYINPEPTAGPAHNYTFLLFAQPEAYFQVPSEYASFLPLNLSNIYARVGFPLLDFIHDTGLGEPVAGNWFRESAATDSTSSSAIPSRSVSVCSITSSSSASATPTVKNTTTTSVVATGTVSIPFSSGATSVSAGTGTSTATSPAYTGQATVSSPGIGKLLLGLSVAAVMFGLL